MKTRAGWFLLAAALAGCRADFGDAPDRELRRLAGYYWGPNPPAKFRVSRASDGLRTKRGDEVFIDNIYGIPTFGFVPPSLERDSNGTPDPDGCTNNRPPGVGPAGDWDVENASYNPCPRANPAVPFGGALPNGYLFIMAVGVPPVAMFGTSIYGQPREGVFWNVLFDTDRDGAWSGGREWVVRNTLVSPSPTGTFVLSRPFAFGNTATFGALAMPQWARNAVTTDRIRMAEWDGADGEHASGEVEDYFIEWRAVGQQEDDAAGAPPASSLPSLSCPASAAPGTEFTCEAPAAEGFKGVLVACLSGGDETGWSGKPPARVEGEGAACGGALSASLAQGRLKLKAGDLPAGTRLLLAPAPADGRLVTVAALVDVK